MSKQPRTLAIVLNWQQPTLTLACVDALAASEGVELDILVVDNGSGDESEAVLKKHQSSFELLTLPENRGFAGGNNAGLQLAIDRGYDYALLINNDAFVDPHMMARLLVQGANDVGLLSPKIMYAAEPDRIWFAGGYCHPQTLDMRGSGIGQRDSAAYRQSKDVDYLLGACLLVSLPAVRVVGLLDERYFFYFEDLDWSLRFSEAGYRLRLVSDALAYHQVAVSTGGEEDTAARRYYLAFGSVLFWRGNARLGNPFFIAAFRLASALKMVTRLLVQGKKDVALAYLRGLKDGWRAS